jgi:hypothetical protein
MVLPIEKRIEADRMNLIIWIDKLEEIVKKDNFKENLHYIEQYSNSVFQFGTVLVEQCRKQALEAVEKENNEK